MADTPLLLREQQYHQIKAVLARLRMDSAAKVVFLIDKDGQEIASQGEIGNLDTTSLASLAAGNVAATGGMAQLIGEKEFPTLSHEGERESIHISVIGRLLLIVVFDDLRRRLEAALPHPSRRWQRSHRPAPHAVRRTRRSWCLSRVGQVALAAR